MKNAFSKLKNPQVLKKLGLGILVILVIAGFFYFEKTQGRVSIENSLVNAPISTIAPSAGGTLTELDVYEGQQVKKGDKLAVVGGQALYADTNGVIISAPNQVGSTVGTTTQLIQLINPNDMRIAGTIDENKGLADIKVGQVASFTVDALPGQTFWGYVDEISPSAKTTALSFSISSERPTQQFVVYVRFDANKYPTIKNGMSAKLTVYTDTK